MSRAPEIAGSTAAGDAPPAAGDILRDWQAVRDDATIQYAPLPPYKPPVPTTPDWLKVLGQWLQDLFAPLGRALGVSWPTIQYVLIALAALFVLFILWRLVEPLLGRERRGPAAEPEWTPDRAKALALLEDADRLAAEGRFGEATHLLLQRSVGHIADARPDWLHPASTAREIMRMPTLPQRARMAFATIAERVERSRYALRALDAADWTEARAAYSDFALQKIEAAA